MLFGILVIGADRPQGAASTAASAAARNRGAGALLVAALVAMVVGYIGLFFGRLIKAGVSRQREFLADASAVQFTRQTAGLAGALKKIGGLRATARGWPTAATPRRSATCCSATASGFSGLFATHPPLLERIRRWSPASATSSWSACARDGGRCRRTGCRKTLPWGWPQRAARAAGRAASGCGCRRRVVAAQVAAPASDDYRRADAIVDAVRRGAARRWPAIARR